MPTGFTPCSFRVVNKAGAEQPRNGGKEGGGRGPVNQEPYDPLSLSSMAESLVRELLNRPSHSLPPDERFNGCGAYALYYFGDFDPYRPLSERNDPDAEELRAPVYVGKAVPSGARKGLAELAIPDEPSLYRRLREHARTIERAENLELTHFRCRYLITAPVWIRLAENLMLSRYRPLWNSFLDGFGNHDPGSGRYDQERSRWDTLHPGRPWAERLAEPDDYTADSLAEEVREYLTEGPASQAGATEHEND